VAPEIMDRVNEITFSSNLISEFPAIDVVTRLVAGRITSTTATSFRTVADAQRLSG